MLKRYLMGLFLIATLLSSSAAVWAEDSKRDNTIQVQGSGSVTTEFDSVQVNIGVESKAKTMAAARQKNAEAMTAVLSSLKRLGIANLKLKTSVFDANPENVWDGDKRKITGYIVNNQLTAKVEKASTSDLGDIASKLIDTATLAGATNVGNASFYVSDTNAYVNKALALAIQQAKQTATAIADAAGVKITGVYAIETYSQATPIRRDMMSAKAMYAPSAEMAPTPIEVGDNEVSATVTIRYTFTN